MSLKALRLPTRSVTTPGGDLVVRGLSLADVAFLVREHGPALRALFANAEAGGLDLSRLADVSADLLLTAPTAAVDAIVLGCGEDPADVAATAVAGALPFPNQLELVEAIAQQTFVSEDATKKVLETAIRVFRGLTSRLATLAT